MTHSKSTAGHFLPLWDERKVLATTAVATSILNLLRGIYALFTEYLYESYSSPEFTIIADRDMQSTRTKLRIGLALLTGAIAFWTRRGIGPTIARIAWLWIVVEYALWWYTLRLIMTSVEVPSAFSVYGLFMETGSLWDLWILVLAILLLAYEIRTARPNGKIHGV